MSTLPDTAEPIKNSAASTFLHRIFGKVASGYVAIWSLPSKASAFFPVGDLARAAELVEQLDAKGEDVYFGVCPHATRPTDGRGTKATVGSVPTLWIDIDLRAPAGAHKAGDALPPDDDAVAELLLSIDELPPPSVIVHSGYGVHLYWPLTAPVLPLAGAATVRAVQAVIKQAAEAKGWQIDATHDLARVLRVPGGHNRKIAGAAPEVTILLNDVHDHELSAFDPVVKRACLLPAPANDRAAVEAARDSGADRAQALALDVVRDRLTKVRDAGRAGLIKKLLKGESIAAPGSRDEAMQRVCSIVAFVAPHNDPAQLADLFRPMLTEWASEDGAKLTLDEEIDKAIDKIERAQVDKRRHDAAERAEAEAFMRVEKTAAVDQGVALGELRKLYILQPEKSGIFYLRHKDGTYTRPVGSQQLFTKARDTIEAWAGVRLQVPTKAGMRMKHEKELLRDHAKVVSRIVASITAQKTTYDPAIDTLYEATCPLRPLTPCYHEQVDAWLRKLGGQHAEKVLDWLATVTALDRPTCILYVEGEPSAGKSMLAQSIARLWTEGQPTAWANAIDRFNGRILECPFIWADEALEGDSSADIRRLSGADGFEVEEKYQPKRSVRGAPRILLTANDGNLLTFAKERFERAAIDAVALRFLHVVADRDTPAYLESIGGRHGDPARGLPGTVGWVDGDIIARHLLWLRDNRKVTPGARFMVQGDAVQTANKLAFQGARREAAATWLIEHLSKVHSDVEGVIAGGGKLLVHGPSIFTRWDVYNVQPAPTSAIDLGRDLAGMSDGAERPRLPNDDKRRFQRPKHHSIRVDDLITFAEQHMIGDAEKLRARINEPLS